MFTVSKGVVGYKAFRDFDPEKSYYPGSQGDQGLNKISTRRKKRNASTLVGLELSFSGEEWRKCR